VFDALLCGGAKKGAPCLESDHRSTFPLVSGILGRSGQRRPGLAGNARLPLAPHRLPGGVHEKPPGALVDELLRRSRPAEEVVQSELPSQLTERLMARATQLR
jgi:hypothetical protein